MVKGQTGSDRTLCEYPSHIEGSTLLQSVSDVWDNFPKRAKTFLSAQDINTFEHLIFFAYVEGMAVPSLVNRLSNIYGIIASRHPR